MIGDVRDDSTVFVRMAFVKLMDEFHFSPNSRIVGSFIKRRHSSVLRYRQQYDTIEGVQRIANEARSLLLTQATQQRIEVSDVSEKTEKGFLIPLTNCDGAPVFVNPSKIIKITIHPVIPRAYSVFLGTDYPVSVFLEEFRRRLYRFVVQNPKENEA